MKFRVYRLKNGKLEYIDFREAKAGDAILAGETSVAEVARSVEVHLREGLIAGPTPEEINRARKMLKDEATEKVRASWKRLIPNATTRQLDILASGRVPKENWV